MISSSAALRLHQNVHVQLFFPRYLRHHRPLFNGMLPTSRPAAKEYNERGVQTDPPKTSSPSLPPYQPMNSTPPQNTDHAGPHEAVFSSPGENLTSPAHDEDAYTQDPIDSSFESTSSGANQSMMTTSRAYRVEKVSVNLPTTLANKMPTPRVVSLPEATPKFRLRRVFEKKARVVSMPAAATRNASPHSLDGPDDPFVSEDEARSRVRVRSQATDVPYTPSAPSSPDSVVIIANNSNQLSNDFLRPRVEEPPESDDEGMSGRISSDGVPIDEQAGSPGRSPLLDLSPRCTALCPCRMHVVLRTYTVGVLLHTHGLTSRKRSGRNDYRRARNTTSCYLGTRKRRHRRHTFASQICRSAFHS